MKLDYDSIVDDVCPICSFDDFNHAEWCDQRNKSDELETDQNFNLVPDFQEDDALFDFELGLED